MSRPVVVAQPTTTPGPKPGLPSTATPTLPPTDTPRPTVTPRPTFTPSPSATPTNSPTPTQTPLPSDRLATAQGIYAGGDYERARLEFEALLADPGAAPHERRQALHWRGRSELEAGDTTAAIDTLKTFLQQYPGDELTRAAQFNLGRAYEQAGQSQEAITAYLGSIIPDDPVNVYIYERIGDIGLRTGTYTETVTAYQAGIDSTDEPTFKVQLREGIAEAEILFNNDLEAAIAQYETILSSAKIESYRAKILRLLGNTYLAGGDSEAGYERYLEAVNLYPEAEDSYLALVELIEANVPVDEFQRGLVDYHAAAYQPAVAAFERYLASIPPAVKSDVVAGPGTGPISTTITFTKTQTITKTTLSGPTLPDHRAEALWYLGLSWKALGQYSRAIQTFQRLVAEYPGDPNWGEAHLEIGRTLINQGSHSQGKAALRDFAAQEPDHTLAPEAMWRAARLDMSDDLLAEAHTHLHILVDTYPNSEYAPDALYWAGQISYQVEDYEGAVADWSLMATEYPDHELFSFGTYWRARALLELGRRAEAETILTQLADDSTDYYVLRARDLLAGTQPQMRPLRLPGPLELSNERAEAEAWLRQWLEPAPTGNLSLAGSPVQNDPAFQRGQALLELGLRDIALVEFETVKDNWWHNPLAMYQLSIYFNQQGLGRLSIISAARLIFLSPIRTAEEAPIFIQRLYYPIYFEDLIFAEAEALQVDPALVAAIIRQESLFELSAHSPAGARGLMQVMPATGEYVAGRNGFDNFNPDQLWLPYISVKLGSWYINQQLGIFDDNQFAALAAYNAGPGNVLAWIKTSDDPDIFVESIPFRESRLYVRRIYVNLAAYRRVYGEP